MRPALASMHIEIRLTKCRSNCLTASERISPPVAPPPRPNPGTMCPLNPLLTGPGPCDACCLCGSCDPSDLCGPTYFSGTVPD